MAPDKINDRLTLLISELELNPNSFAEKIGVSTPVVYNIVRGRRNKPSFDLLLKILNVYKNINTAWLLKGEGHIWIDKSYDEIADGALVEEEGDKRVGLEPRINILLQNLSEAYGSDASVEELGELIQILIEENNNRRDKIIRLYEKNEKLMDVLRRKLGLDI